ncbi:hypothetical protein [Ferruginibacter sp.]|uniref:hypothetical protein n=1 Tax=Ferruginibacter sp. TaxID=1940288 RepID=UPI00265A7C9D|nr:hypothetical protein [Ferruginibacter sp.]
MKKISILSIMMLLCCHAMAQIDSSVYSKFTTAQNRIKFYSYLIKNSITKNLSLPLNDSTEENWEDAFSAMELIYYKEPWTKIKLKIAADDLRKRSMEFQRSFMELLYATGQKDYTQQADDFFKNTANGKVFAMCAEYLLKADSSEKNKNYIYKIAANKSNLFSNDNDSLAVVNLLKHLEKIYTNKKITTVIFFKPLFKKAYLKGNTVVYSLQRKNRNYPGILVIKDTAGNFVTNSNGEIFRLPQLARSLSNMPGYLTNGNTPQGIYRLYGFDKSRNNFIGPTENLQLTMPFETSIRHFLKDSSITDTTWKINWYQKLLPSALVNYQPLYESYFASSAGRTEIIAHGTAVDAEFYKGQMYYPYTPTAGCLCTKELWNADGRRIVSDQQKLADAVKKAGGADGYLIVIEINDAQKPVSPEEILPLLQ